MQRFEKDLTLSTRISISVGIGLFIILIAWLIRRHASSHEELEKKGKHRPPPIQPSPASPAIIITPENQIGLLDTTPLGQYAPKTGFLVDNMLEQDYQRVQEGVQNQEGEQREHQEQQEQGEQKEQQDGQQGEHQEDHAHHPGAEADGAGLDANSGGLDANDTYFDVLYQLTPTQRQLLETRSRAQRERVLEGLRDDIYGVGDEDEVRGRSGMGMSDKELKAAILRHE